jgi:hypothetical protein
VSSTWGLCGFTTPHWPSFEFSHVLLVLNSNPLPAFPRSSGTSQIAVLLAAFPDTLGTVGGHTGALQSRVTTKGSSMYSSVVVATASTRLIPGKEAHTSLNHTPSVPTDPQIWKARPVEVAPYTG